MSISTGLSRNWAIVLRRIWAWAYFGEDPSNIAPLPACFGNGDYIYALNTANSPTTAQIGTPPSGLVALIGLNSSDQVVLPNGAITPTGSVGLSATVTLSSAQILTLHSVPVSLLPAPGAGKALVVEQLLLEMTTTSTAYAAGGAVAPVYHGATAAITGNTIPATVITAGAGTSNTLLSIGAPTNGLTLSANTGVDLYAASADFTTGTGTAKVIVYYKIITL